MGLLAPLFALGMALIGIPYLVHRIRRPEREPVRFSSLMFVPEVKREVIERRRVQHLLLMILRMAMLAVLALAFARPFREVISRANASLGGATDHVIALDVSMSMGYDGVWARAKMQANAALDAVAPGDRVGFARFANRAWGAVPISGDATLVRRAIDEAAVTWAHTDYATALRATAHLFEADTAQVRRVVHVISDFQATGMADAGWRLPGTIKLHAVDVGVDQASNATIDALAVLPAKNDALQVRARVRNNAGQNALAVQLSVNREIAETRTVEVLPGNATQVGFAIPAHRETSGYVALANGDGLTRDDRRFFAWAAQTRHSIEVWQAAEATRFMLNAALPEESDLPWRLDWSSRGAGSVVIAEAIDAQVAAELADYVQRGGALFLPLGKSADIASANAVLARADLRIVGLRQAGYSALAWVNLDHPIFQLFRGARFNDFSSVRYDNTHLVAADSAAVVLAKYDDEMPAMVEARLGAGRILVWAGGMGLDRSNLARTPRFVPLLHETLRYLVGEQKVKTAYQVGDAAPEAVRQLAGPKAAGDPARFHAPGIYEWDGQLAAVNVAHRESDLTRITPAEFEIRLCDAPALNDSGPAATASHPSTPDEYGRYAIALLFALALAEHFFASRKGYST